MKRTTLAIAALLWATVSFASWYDDYDAGLDAIRAGNWQLAVQKMTAAINAHANESNRERTYGAIFINYHPYYYRGVAYLNTGKYQQAVADFEKTSGPGADDYGSLDTLMQKAKAKLAEANTAPVPAKPEPKPPEPKPVAVPAIDAALRTRARTALDSAKSEIDKARARNATDSPDYQKALTSYQDANLRWANAKSNDDLNAVLAQADNITLLAESAHGAAAPQPVPGRSGPDYATPPIHGRVPGAEGKTLEETRLRLRTALESYFNGDFDEAEQRFRALTQELPKNGWVWAFLGASQYSQYAFEGEQSYKASAMESFRKAKTFGKWKDGLPDKYFSRKIRKAFKETAG